MDVEEGEFRGHSSCRHSFQGLSESDCSETNKHDDSMTNNNKQETNSNIDLYIWQ